MEHEHLEALYPDMSRFSEIEKIIHVVKEGGSCQMVGMPGVGRGNVCKFLAYNHHIRVKHLGKEQTSYHFVFINFAEVKNRPLFEVMKFMFLELVSSLHERRFDTAFEEVDAMFKKALSYKDELVLFEGLKSAIDYLVFEQKLHVIMLLERFELYIPHVTDDFFVNLRSLRDRAKYKFSVVFSVTRPLEDTLEAGIMADFYEFFAEHTIYLSLCDKPGILFRIAHLQEITQKKLPEKIIENVLSLTAGHGKLTRLSIEALLAKEPNELGSFLLSQKSIQAGVKEIWDFLTPEEQQTILTSGTTTFLEEIGLVENKQVIIPLMRAYIQTKTKMRGTLPSHFIYDSSTNTISKGDITISDKLTSAEFRLFRFLLENPGRIVEREEIITAVWKDLASTVGVTDQALDQLIFRLRKKIEDNPNAPIHLETIKGRGVRFQN